MSEINKEEFLRDVIATVNHKIHPLKVRNVYIYGSRVYGTFKKDSDYDIIMLAPALIEHEEIRGSCNDLRFNIHIHTPDKFKEDLNKYMIHCLECHFAPEWAKLQEKEKFADFKINSNKLKQSILTQSANTWNNAKYKFNNGDIIRGLKSGFHALKALNFGIQLLEKREIYDFSQNNDLQKEVMESEIYEWRTFKEKYLPAKIVLEEKFKNLNI